MSTLDVDVRLAVPEGIFDLMAPQSDEEARAVLGPLVAGTFPRAGDHDRGVLLEGLLSWRRVLLAHGVAMHGVVSVPAGVLDDGTVVATPAHWHLLAGPVPLPDTGEVNAGHLLVRLLGHEFEEQHTYVEEFPTAMGWGAGMITTVPVTPPGQLDPALRASVGQSGEEPTPLLERFGLTVAVSGAPDASIGLLVVGLCLDSERIVDLAALAALVAGQSTIERVAELDAEGVA